MEGLVINKNANLFTIEGEEGTKTLSPSGKVKEKGVFVGDRVEFEESITKVLERKNLLIRPPLANLDKMFIVIAPVPKPDFVLVDKILVYCHVNGIEPIIVVNKIDIASMDFISGVKVDYAKDYKVIFTCPMQKITKDLEKEIEGICALAGQSAVGKSSLINAIFEGEQLAEIGELSAKVERGKQTTRMVSLYKKGRGYIADTAGFSLLDLSFVSQLDERDLASYYPDFLAGREGCKYRSCLHKGGECGVVKEVAEGKISQRRYQNYLKILDELENAKKY